DQDPRLEEHPRRRRADPLGRRAAGRVRRSQSARAALRGPRACGGGRAGTFFDPNLYLVFQNYFDNKARFLGIENYTEEGFAHMHRAVPLVLEVFKQALRRPKLRIVFGTDAVAGAFGKNWEELIYRVQVGGQAPMAAMLSATSLAARSLAL